MDAILEFAKLFRERENGKTYTPLIGTIKQIEPMSVQVGDRITLTEQHLLFLFDVKEKEEGTFIHQGKQVALLPIDNFQKFIAAGVIFDVS